MTKTVMVGAVLFGAMLSAGCKKEPAQQPVQQGQPQPYQNAPPPTYGQNPYGTGNPYGSQPAPTQPTAGGFAPAPLSPPCSQPEGTCGFARCNVQVGRCAFPCNSNADCIAGSSCVGMGTPLAVCAPMPGAPQ